MKRLQRVSINILSGGAGYMVPIIINFFITPLLLGWLGQAAYGLQSLVAVIVGYLSFMDMGLDLPITKYLAEDLAQDSSKSANHLLNTTLLIYSLIGIIGMLAIFALANWLATDLFTVPGNLINQAVLVFRLAGLGFLGSVILSWSRAVAMGLQRLDISYGVSLIINIIGTIVGLIAVYLGYGVVGYVGARVCSSLLGGPLCWGLIHHLLPWFHFRFSFHWPTLQRIRNFLGYSTFNRIIGSLFSRIDQTLLGIWLGVAVAGVYAIPFLIVNSLGYMLSYMLGYVLPMTSEFTSLGQMEKLREMVIRSTQFITAVATLIYIPLLVLGDLFLRLWVGADLADQATVVLRLMTIAGYFGVLSTAVMVGVIIGKGHMREFVLYNLGRSIVLGIGCLIFIRPLGLAGVGWAWLLASIVDIICVIIAWQRFLGIPAPLIFRRAFLKPMLLGLALLGIALPLRWLSVSWPGLVGSGIILFIFYAVLSFYFGIFGETEKQAISGLWQIIFRPVMKSDIS